MTATEAIGRPDNGAFYVGFPRHCPFIHHIHAAAASSRSSFFLASDASMARFGPKWSLEPFATASLARMPAVRDLKTRRLRLRGPSRTHARTQARSRASRASRADADPGGARIGAAGRRRAASQRPPSNATQRGAPLWGALRAPDVASPGSQL